MSARRRSISLVSDSFKLGFTRDRSRCMRSLGTTCANTWRACKATALNITIEGHVVRPAAETDFDACNRICRQVHGHDRAGELRDAIARGNATVVEHDGRVTGYATIVGFFGPAVGETNADVKGSSALQETS